MLNNVIIMGRLVSDPVVRTTSNGTMVANMRIACDRDVTAQAAQNGEKKADFFDVIAWRKTAEFATKYFFKGKPILIQGRLQSRNWEDKTGQKRTSIEIIANNIEFCGGDRVNGGGNGNTQQPNPNAPVTQAELDSFLTDLDGDDDDLPWA